MKLIAPVRLLVLMVGLAAWSGLAFADCTNPASPEGGLDYDASAHEFKYCDNTNTWQSLGGGGAVSSLSDVNVTNVAGRDYLRYDAGSSKWVNISESTVMSTTTMVSNWPDAIFCTGSSGSMVLYHSIDFSNGTYSYDRAAASDNRKTFTSAGAYSSGSDSGYSTDCINKSISQLYASGQAFNFIGNADTGGGALGDRITSGTLVVVANSATSYVSLSTGGTTWGYLSSGANYLPGLDIGNVGRILSANISAASSGKGLELRFISNTDRAYITSYDRGGSAYKPLTTDSSYFSVNTAGAERLRIDASGNVGIGTTSPAYKLVVQGGDGSNPGLVVTSGAATSPTSINWGVNGAASAGLLGVAGVNGNYWASASAGDSVLRSMSGKLHFTTGYSTPGMSMDTSGNLGIGTSSPKAKLDVAGTISASDAVQVGSSSLTCSASIAGAMRYTSGTMQVCNGSSWGNVGIGVPTGTIAAFALSSCPSGWNEYTAARGRFLRGIDNGAGNDPAGTRAASSIQADAVQNASGTVGTQILDENDAGALADGVFNATKVANRAPQGGSGLSRNTIDFDLSRQIRTSTETRPKNVAVIFCQYAGFESSLSAGVATLASLSDVSIGGASNGQALVFNGASWVPSTTTGAGASAVSSTGAIQFNAGSGAFGGDTASLFWDNGNKRLGIGTTSPAATLDVSGTAQIRHGANMWGGLYVSEQGVSNEGFHISHYGGSASGVVLSQEGSLPIRFSVNGNEVARIHGNGNVGIGTTNPGHKLDIENTAGHSGIAINAGASSAAYIDFESSGTKVSNVFYDGANDVFKINSVGSKNTSINTNGGNVGIGTATPSSKLEVSGTVNVVGPWDNNTTNGLHLSFGSDTGRIYSVQNGVAWRKLIVDGSPLLLNSISGGNVGIGTTSPTVPLTIQASDATSYALQLRGRVNNGGEWSAMSFSSLDGLTEYARIQSSLSKFLLFYTADSGNVIRERMRIDTNGNMGIGTNAPNQGRVEVMGGSVCVDTNSDGNASSCIASESDARLKTNVKPLENSLEKIVALRGVSFDWRVSDTEVLKHYPLISRFENRPHSVGLIAQEVQKVLPEAIEEETVGDDEVQYMQLDYTKLVPLLIEGVKELKAANDDLRDEVEELKGRLSK